MVRYYINGNIGYKQLKRKKTKENKMENASSEHLNKMSAMAEQYNTS